MLISLGMCEKISARHVTMGRPTPSVRARPWLAQLMRLSLSLSLSPAVFCVAQCARKDSCEVDFFCADFEHLTWQQT